MSTKISQSDLFTTSQDLFSQAQLLYSSSKRIAQEYVAWDASEGKEISPREYKEGCWTVPFGEGISPRKYKEAAAILYDQFLTLRANAENLNSIILGIESLSGQLLGLLAQEVKNNIIQVRDWYSEICRLASEVSDNAEEWYLEGEEIESCREDEARAREEGQDHLNDLYSLGLTDDDFGGRD